MVTVGVKLVLVAEGTDGKHLLLLSGSGKEGSAEVALHSKLVVNGDEEVIGGFVGEGPLPGVGLAGLECLDKSAETLLWVR